MAERKKAAEPEVILDETAEQPKSSGPFGFLHKDAKPKEKRAESIPAHVPESEIAELVGVVNMPLALLSPRDALTPWEQQRLTAALHTYAEKDRNARKWLSRIAQKSAIFALLDVAVAIAIPRMVRHGIITPAVAPYFAGVCDTAQLADAAGLSEEQFAAATQAPPPGGNGLHPEPSPVPGGSYEVV